MPRVGILLARAGTAAVARMNLRSLGSTVAAGLLCGAAPARAQAPPAPPPAPPPAAQNPSPMIELSRAHLRTTPTELAGTRRTFNGPLNKPVELFITPSTRGTRAIALVIHFLGAPFIPELAVSKLGRDHAVAIVSIGSGSGIFDRTFSDPAVYDSLLSTIQREATAALNHPVTIGRVTLSGFSAGHGAIRAILRDSAHFAQVDGVLLLDGMHTSYVPEGTVLDKGGTLDPRNLEAWVRFGQAAMRGEKRFLITHSEIFPGTFVSTTETADYLVRALGIERKPVLRWGPGGMQQLSEARRGHFTLLGFAGNSAPDHVDQFQGMPVFLRMLERR